MSNILLVDGYGLFIRHYSANPTISENGYHVGGVVGFLKALQFAIQKHFANRVYIVWEGGGSGFRRSLLSTYKDKRRPIKMNKYYDEQIDDTYESRNRQILTLIKLLKHTPFCQLYVPDCEADDIIAYLCKYVHNNENKIILSSDKDFYQLLDKKTWISTTIRKKLIGCDDVKGEFGISYKNFALAKAVVGDRSDKIDGIKGAGFKTLAKRFPILADDNDVLLEELFDYANSNASSKILLYSRVLESRELITRNWKLVYLDTASLTNLQLKRSRELIENFSPKNNKFEFMRAIIECGLNKFDVDGFFFPMTTIRW